MIPVHCRLKSRFWRSNRYDLNMSPLRNAFLAQIVGAVTTAATINILYPKLFLQPLICAILQGTIAAVTSYKIGAARWWIPIHLCFLPLAIGANQLGIPPITWLGAFLLFFMLFWRTDKSQVPLFLTNAKAARSVAGLLPRGQKLVVDLGCGTGSLIKYLAVSRPESHFVGIEHAPLPFLIAWVRSRGITNLQVQYGNFWNENLGRYQVVYAFLSPVPMPELWAKACGEMSPQSLLISNSFKIPGVSPSRVIDVLDRRRTRLLCYEIGIATLPEDHDNSADKAFAVLSPN